MPADADEPSKELRIGRWLPAADREDRPEDTPTVAVPTVAEAGRTRAGRSSMDDGPAPPPPIPPDASPEPAAPSDAFPEPAAPSAASPEPAPPVPVPPDASPAPTPRHAVPPDRSPEIPARRRPRHLTFVAAITLALAVVAAVATAVALAIKPSETGGEAAPPALPTVLASSVEADGVSPSGIPPPTGDSTPSATLTPSGTPSGVSPSATSARPGARLDVSVEAEAPATVLGGRTRIQAMAAASGGAVVSRIGGGAVHYVRFAPITVAESATYTLTIHYVSTASRRAVITVNGRMAATVACPGTDTVGRVSVQVRLVAGANTIEYGNDDAPAPDLDRITVIR